jgi:glycosyltransferase involved in cell wall biosynthesis
MSKKYSVIIPVYQSENCLEKVHQSITSFFENRYEYEIIYVDDASEDLSWEVLKKIKQSSAKTTIIRLSKNFGQHAATVCGFKYAKGDFIVTMDDDLEVHPLEILKLIEHQDKYDSDVVYGIYKKQNQPFFRGILTGIYKFSSKLEGSEKGKGSSFRLIKNKLSSKIALNHTQFTFIDELCLWYTQKITFVNVIANPDYILKKRYGMIGLLRITSNVVMFSSTLPLKFVTQMGMLLAFINFLIGSIFIVKKFYFKIDVEGFTSLIVSILFSTGMIIFCLGIMAQYISQSLKALNNAPSYNEDEIIC